MRLDIRMSSAMFHTHIPMLSSTIDTSLVPRLPHLGTRTLKLCKRGEPGILRHVKSAKDRREVDATLIVCVCVCVCVCSDRAIVSAHVYALRYGHIYPCRIGSSYTTRSTTVCYCGITVCLWGYCRFYLLFATVEPAWRRHQRDHGLPVLQRQDKRLDKQDVIKSTTSCVLRLYYDWWMIDIYLHYR